MKPIYFLFCIVIIYIFSCKVEKARNTSSPNVAVISEVNPSCCKQLLLTDNNKSVESTHNISNLDLINGFKGIQFSNSLSCFKQCLNDVDTISDFISGKLSEFSYLDISWRVELIAYKDSIISISIFSDKASAFYIHTAFNLLLGEQNELKLNCFNSKERTLRANISSVRYSGKYTYIENINDVKNEITNSPTLNLPLRGSVTSEKKYQPPKRNSVDAYFKYLYFIQFKEAWKSKSKLEILYTRISNLNFYSEFEAKDLAEALCGISTGYCFNKNWDITINFYKNESSIRLLDLLAKMKLKEHEKQENNRKLLEEERIIRKF